jgi:hypothetical protein
VSLAVIMLVLGLLASLSPSTVVVFSLLLATARARANAAAFLIGWSISLVIVFLVSYAVGGAHATEHGGGHSGVEAIEILLGFALVVAGVGQWCHRRRPPDGIGGHQGLHVPTAAAQPVGSDGRRRARTTLGAHGRRLVVVRHYGALLVTLAAFVLFTVASTATIGLIFLYSARRPGEAEAHLSALRDRVVEAGPALFAVVSALVGAYLAVDSVVALTPS